jgi:phosphoserine phosphatase RsbU/P
MSSAASAQITAPPSGFWRSLFGSSASADRKASATPVACEPAHCNAPALRGAEIAAVYYDRRMGGDFYEFLRVSPARVLFCLLDVAGRHEEVRQTLVETQSVFRNLGHELFGGRDVNEATAMAQLCQTMNETVLRGGVRHCPAILGCYQEEVGTVCYANAGSTPPLLRDGTGVTVLAATGLPFGLFTHTVYGSSTCALEPGAALLAVSRGIVEAETAGEEFGLDRTMTVFAKAGARSAHGICLDVLQGLQNFLRSAPTHNDVTALVVRRNFSL